MQKNKTVWPDHKNKLTETVHEEVLPDVKSPDLNVLPELKWTPGQSAELARGVRWLPIGGDTWQSPASLISTSWGSDSVILLDLPGKYESSHDMSVPTHALRAQTFQGVEPQ